MIEIPFIAAIVLFSGWITSRHYHNKYDIEQLRIDTKRSKELNDLLRVQDNLDRIRQSITNLDAKYRMKYDDINDRLEQLLKVVIRDMSEQDIFDSFTTGADDTLTIGPDNTNSHLKVISTVQDALDEISKGKKN
jgi:branched-subunit amino acid aminotransferase/4-amino-4-deoxychorismate lyase